MEIRILGLTLLILAGGSSGWANDVMRPKGPEEDGTKPALARIAGQGMMDSHAFEYLTELSDEVGARVTGSPQSKKAIDWGLMKMKAIGLENVHGEKWTMWKGWTRGSAAAELISRSITRLVWTPWVGRARRLPTAWKLTWPPRIFLISTERS